MRYKTVNFRVHQRATLKAQRGAWSSKHWTEGRAKHHAVVALPTRDEPVVSI